jgi:hypothetical protein
MKKMLVLALALVFILSGAVMAQHTGGVLDPFEYGPGAVGGSEWLEGGDYDDYDDHFGDDGIVFVNDVDPKNPGDYTNLEEFDRTYSPDHNNLRSPKQEVEIKVPVEAYIPCYLEMRLTGNQGTTSAISYGPNATASGSTVVDGYGYQMTFDNEIGGYLDDEWQSLGHGSNVEIDPGDEVFIGACDIFAVEVISNDDYKYQVKSKALQGQDGASGEFLPMYMRTALDGGTWLGTDTIFDSETSAYDVFEESRVAGETLEALHNFKVPFSMNTVHGEYNGEVIFRAVTI